MIDFEITEMEAANQFARLMNPRVDFETPYIFYCDQTNNIKTFYVGEHDFNYTFASNFVLGGLLHQRDEPDVKPLIYCFKLSSKSRGKKSNRRKTWSSKNRLRIRLYQS